MAKKEWVILKSKKLKDGTLLEMTHWPWPDSAGGNKRDTYWVREYRPIGVSVNNEWYWGTQAREKAEAEYERREETLA